MLFNAMAHYFKNVLLGLDQLANTILGGYPDETISSRAYRKQWRIYPVIDRLFFWDRDHCKSSMQSEERRTQLPPSLRA